LTQPYQTISLAGTTTAAATTLASNSIIPILPRNPGNPKPIEVKSGSSVGTIISICAMDAIVSV
jgi:hypothetical protein